MKCVLWWMKGCEGYTFPRKVDGVENRRHAVELESAEKQKYTCEYVCVCWVGFIS